MPHTNCGEGKVIERKKRVANNEHILCVKKVYHPWSNVGLENEKRRKKNQDNDNKKSFSFATMLLIFSHLLSQFCDLFQSTISLSLFTFFYTYYIIYDTILWRHCAYVHVLYCCVLLCCDSSISLVITFSILNSFSLPLPALYIHCMSWI